MDNQFLTQVKFRSHIELLLSQNNIVAVVPFLILVTALTVIYCPL